MPPGIVVLVTLMTRNYKIGDLPSIKYKPVWQEQEGEVRREAILEMMMGQIQMMEIGVQGTLTQDLQDVIPGEAHKMGTIMGITPLVGHRLQVGSPILQDGEGLEVVVVGAEEGTPQGTPLHPLHYPLLHLHPQVV